ncbi:hypothetical protein QSH57_014105 [Fusarium oxysporum f. sp. vasinfectum]|nr:hypothetical protein QSH57_014105 [Fusarium oxysporum f. sp. vasinfectum]
MSYDLESGRRGGGYSDDPAFQELQYDLKSKLQTLLSSNRKLANDKQQKYEQTKVSSDFQAALQEFQSLQRKALEKERASVTAARAAQEGEHAEGPQSGNQLEQLQQQEQVSQLAPQDEVDFQEALIIEREEEIRNIEQGVGDLNVLFRQVAQIVNEQGEQLGTIADNVENVRDDTRQADVENRQAARYQKAARNKSCCLLLILAVILTIVILAIVLD